MNRSTLLSVLVATTGWVTAGVTYVQAQIDKNTVFQPVGLESTVLRATVVWQEELVPVVLDGGFDADGGWRDGGWTGLYDRHLKDDARIEAEGFLLPKVPHVAREPCNVNAAVTRAQLSTTEAAVKAVVVPYMSARCGVAQTDGGN